MKFDPKYLSFRIHMFLGAVFCFGLVGYAYYLQAVQGLEPCPLCIFQRVAFIATGVVLLVAAAHNPARIGRWVYLVAGSIASIAGASIAGRHIWLRHLPADQVPACGPGLDFMLEAFPLSKTLKTVFTGSGECAAPDGWMMLGLDMPSWAFIAFVGLLLLILHAQLRAKGKESKA